jgi:hypothetical protein
MDRGGPNRQVHILQNRSPHVGLRYIRSNEGGHGGTYRRVCVGACRRRACLECQLVRQDFDSISGCIEETTSISQYADTPIRRYDSPAADSSSPRLGLLEVELVHVIFGAVDPAVAKDNFVIYQADFFVAGFAEIHAIGDFLAIQDHHGNLVHEVTCD